MTKLRAKITAAGVDTNASNTQRTRTKVTTLSVLVIYSRRFA